LTIKLKIFEILDFRLQIGINLKSAILNLRFD